ncbi:hypothetical protein AZH53_00830 [Methanomicrobiaceae archaeon CYW5]|nr:hypothetical protein [Methanovulcanius yangii]
MAIFSIGMVALSIYYIFNESKPENIICSIKKANNLISNKKRIFEELGSLLQQFADVIHPSIQKSDFHAVNTGLQCISQTIDELKENQNINPCDWEQISKLYTTRLSRFGRDAIGQKDEDIAIRIINQHLNFLKLHINQPRSERSLIQSYQIDPVINSISDIGIASVEAGLGRATLEALKGLYFCGCIAVGNLSESDTSTARLDHTEYGEYKFTLLKKEIDVAIEENICISQKVDTAEMDSEEVRKNFLNASINATQSISAISQIASHRNYEQIAINSVDCIGKIGWSSCKMKLDSKKGYTKDLPGRIIWKMKDAGITAASCQLEGATIYFEKILNKIALCAIEESNTKKRDAYRPDQYPIDIIHADENKLSHYPVDIAKALREIGQIAGENKLESAIIRNSLYLSHVGIECVKKNIHYFSRGDAFSKVEREYPSVRVVWCLKDLGKSAAKNGIEKGTVQVIEDIIKILSFATDRWHDKSIDKKEFDKISTKSVNGLKEIWENSSSNNLSEARNKIMIFINREVDRTKDKYDFNIIEYVDNISRKELEIVADDKFVKLVDQYRKGPWKASKYMQMQLFDVHES